MRILTFLTLGIATGLGACSGAETSSVSRQFWDNLADLCGSAFEGTLTEGSEGARANFGSQRMVMHVRHCTDDQIDVPFHVGENRSRTWVFTRGDFGLRLKHDHRHEDGYEDDITQYGGDANADSTASSHHFPADQYSIDMFAAHTEESPGLVGAEYNLWTVDVIPGEIFAYQLTRTHDPDVRFRVEFDLTQPVEAPPPAWGHE